MVKRFRIGLSCTIAIAVSSAALAQWREDGPAVLTSPSPPAEERPFDTDLFMQRYKAAGSPQMVLFWNISFDDQLQSKNEQLETSSKSGTSERNSFDRTTSGIAGRVTRSSSDGSSTETITQLKSNRISDSAKRSSSLSESSQAQIQTAFAETLRSAGVLLQDRAALMRVTHIEKTNNTVDAKEIEAEAVVGKSNLLVEVLLIPDASAPIGSAFKLAVKDLKKGTEIVSFYTRAIPKAAPVQGGYVATDRGFEWQQPIADEPTFSEIGTKLALETIEKLSRSL